MIEILMCTYNGEEFLEKQLNSLYYQTKQPDLVRIFDDKSTDNTLKILNDFIKEKHLTNWNVTVNEVQKGWRRNFYDAIKNSIGDIVFFCDQDDIWKEDKIEIMSKAMVDNDLLRLSGLQYTIDENDNYVTKKGIVICPEVYDKQVTFEKFNSNIEHFIWKNRIGCAMAISKELVKLLDHFDFVPFFAHDVWCVQLSSFLGRGAVIEYPCINYRIHSNNATAVLIIDEKNNYERKKYYTEKCKESYEYYYNGLMRIRDELSNNQYKKLNKMYNMILLRYQMYQKKSILIWIKLVKYVSSYPKVKNYFSDLLSILNLR